MGKIDFPLIFSVHQLYNSTLDFYAWNKGTLFAGSIQKITMTTWGSINCGGYPSIKLENPDGTHCKTTEKDLNPGNTGVWSVGEGLDDCLNMVVTLDSTLYIQTSSGNDFCPKNVLITPVEGPAYVTNEITDWYDKDNNNKEHKLRECETSANHL